jgi:Asp-tRNA(Asn)/Glu-tRNA(Gln) amidotransferase A subunit family amidase
VRSFEARDPSDLILIHHAIIGSDDSDFGREDPSTDRRPLKQPAPNSSSAKTHLKPKPQKKPRILISTQENNEEEEDLRESLDSILGNESQAFRQAKLNLISENQSTVRFGKKRREVISILSSEAEEAEEEIKPTLHIKGEKEIGAVRRILKADNKLTLREGKRSVLSRTDTLGDAQSRTL